MYSRNQLICALKSLAAEDDTQPNKSYKQLLDYHAQRLNFQSYEHYRSWLSKAPDTALGNLSTQLMERVCATKMPSYDEPYYEITPVAEGYSYYTHWIGYDRNGYEVRVPRPLDAQSSVPELRKLLNYPIYVIENGLELVAWQYKWKATAYVAARLAKVHFFSFFCQDHLVDHDVQPELVRLRSAEKMAKMQGEIKKRYDSF